jgi:SWI/SNF-related matrix-associated actin-dependent regulator 1 of chromatin subfamily A
MRNRYQGNCEDCGIHLDAEEGHACNDGGTWVVRCDDCVAAESPTIRASLDNGLPMVKPEGFLGGDWFRAYRAACSEAGSRFDRETKGNRCSLDSLPRLITELRAADFRVSVDPDLAESLRAEAAAVAAATNDTVDRLTRIQAVLADRGEALYGFQEIGTRWLAARNRALLADEMGLGKTVQALVALNENAPVVVICPAIAKNVWRSEAARWRPDFTTETLKGRKSFRWPAAGEIVITNYDILPKDRPADCLPGTVVIADEAHALKNNKALRTKRFRTISEIARKNDGKVWLLTATPLLNRPPELWALLVAADLHREAFGSWDRFCDFFNGRKGRFGMEWGDRPSRGAAPLLQRVSLRRHRTEVLPDLPTKTHRTITVNGLDAATRRACRDALAAIAAAGIDLDSAEEAAAFFATRGPAFEEMSAARMALATAKIPHLLQLVAEYEEVDEPLVVFSAHRAPIDALANRDGWAVITGDTSDAERGRIKDAFQAGELKGIAGTIQAMGTAVTLTRACHEVFVDLGWTPALNAQAEDRCVRIGQTRGVIVTRLVASHKLDEMVTATLAAKQRLIEGSVEASARTEIEDRAASLAEAAEAIGAKTETADAAAARQEAAQTDRAARRAQRPANGRGNGAGNARREADGAREDWAQAALARVAKAGAFEADDAAFGEALVAQLPALTDAQWKAAIRLAKRYWRQANGPCPEAPIPF